MDVDVLSDRLFPLCIRRLWGGGLGVLLVCWIAGNVLVHDVQGQIQHEKIRLQSLSPAAQAKGGIHLARAGRTGEALSLLKDAVAARPDFIHPAYGAAAYWLGEAHARSGDSTQARSAWHQGFHRVTDAGRFDVRLADAYLRTLSRSQLRTERLKAVDAYTTLLSRVGGDSSAAPPALFRRRVAQLAPLLPDDVFAQVVDGHRSDEPRTWSLRAGAGEALREWWRGLDPYPTTDENERLEEHLTRLIHVRRVFSCPERTSTFDARGTVYLRLGAPYKRPELGYKDGKFFREVFRFGVPTPPSSFPESEIWLYPQVDDTAYYLFAESESSGCFERVRPNDLLPSALTMRRGDSDRGLNIAYSSLMAMRAIYRELALYHPVFSNRAAKIESYADRQEMKAITAEIAEAAGGTVQTRGAEQSRKVGAGVGQTRRVFSNPNLDLSYPTEFVPRMIAQAQREDAAAEKRREENVPRQYTALHEDTAPLPVSVRTVRFLNDDGTTRTEVNWGIFAEEARLQPQDEEDDPAPSMIQFSGAWHSRDRSRTRRRTRRVQLSPFPTRQGSVIVGAPVSFRSAARHHLTMQWAQYQYRQAADSANATLGPKRRFALARADSLQPLRAEADEIEMSDLKVLTLPDTTTDTLADPVEHARPYPFRFLTVDTPLLLSFEIYHLTYGTDDRTRYTVSYEVEGKTQRGWTRLFRGQEPRRTSTTMTRTGSSRRTDEQILVDLSGIERDEPQDVRVSVRVTDEETGSTVDRTVNFVFSPSERP